MFMTVYQYLTTTLDHVGAALRNRSQRGQVAAEYLGMVVVVGVIITGLSTTHVGQDIAGALSKAVAKIFH
jgi:hypothetical protein